MNGGRPAASVSSLARAESALVGASRQPQEGRHGGPLPSPVQPSSLPRKQAFEHRTPAAQLVRAPALFGRRRDVALTQCRGSYYLDTHEPDGSSIPRACGRLAEVEKRLYRWRLARPRLALAPRRQASRRGPSSLCRERPVRRKRQSAGSRILHHLHAEHDSFTCADTRRSLPQFPICEPTKEDAFKGEKRSCDVAFYGNAATLLIGQLKSGSHIGDFVQGEQISRKKEGRPIGISQNFEEAILLHGGRSPEAGFLSARWHPRARTAYCEIRDARRDDREPPTAQSRSAR